MTTDSEESTREVEADLAPDAPTDDAATDDAATDDAPTDDAPTEDGPTGDAATLDAATDALIDDAPPARPRRRAVLIGGALGVAAVVAAVGWMLVFGGERAQQSSEDQARQRLAGAPTTASAAPTDVAPLTRGPMPGLYRFEGSGTETMSLPPVNEQQGPAMPVTVVAGTNGCWDVQIDLNTQHWHKWTYCSVNGELRERANSEYTMRKLGPMSMENTLQFTCEAVVLTVHDEPGTTRPRSCKGSDSITTTETTVEGPSTVVGFETIDVGGQPVAAAHVRAELKMSGASTGTDRTDTWFDRETGMPVRIERHLAGGVDIPVGHVEFTEERQSTLKSMPSK